MKPESDSVLVTQPEWAPLWAPERESRGPIGVQESLLIWPRLPLMKRFFQRRVQKKEFLDKMLERHCYTIDVIKMEMAPIYFFDQTYNPDWVRGQSVRGIRGIFHRFYLLYVDPVIQTPRHIWSLTQVL
jgi:hypothetical protein